MSDPERLSVGSESDLVRRLLRSGRAFPPAGSEERALVAAAAALATTGLLANSAAASGLVSKLRSILALKWVAVTSMAGLGATIAVVAVEARHREPESRHVADAPWMVIGAKRPALEPAPPASATASVSAFPPLSVTSAPSASPPAHAAPHVRTTMPEPAASSGTSFRAELQTLDQARAAVASGDGARAL